MSVNTLPFKINFFKQVERFQTLRQLDQQFETMLEEWKKGGYEKKGLSEKVNVNYPTWEIEKKILFWTAIQHKHLGSPLTTAHLGVGDFREDIHVSETEVKFAGQEEVLKNLVARGFASWEEGAVISKEGLAHGLLIAEIYKFAPEDSIKKGNARYREEKLVLKPIKDWGYKLLYITSLLAIFLSLILLSLALVNQLAIDFTSSLPGNVQVVAIITFFMPALLFLIAFVFLQV